jgi:hypothetical protein
MAKNNQPRTKNQPNPQKQPKITSDPDTYNNKKPAWRSFRLELTYQYGWQNIDAATLRTIHEKLSNFESMTWREILLDSKKQNHTVPVQNLCKEARDRLIELNLDDIDEITSLRLSGTQRIWGILDQGVMELLWWDPHHQVYPSTKKNT